ncbi:MAG: alpha/beta fold hydrolase [Pseudomonadota bacterium]
MVASLQRFLIIATWVVACGWLFAAYSYSRVWAAAGATLLVFAYAAILALEFTALLRLNSRDAVGRPGVRELIFAWLGETRTAASVFFWRQPFRSNAVADRLQGHAPASHGVVFVHGFMCNRGFWTPWMQELVRQNRAFIAPNLEPPLASIDSYAAELDQAITRVTEATGMPPLVVCHSMGGLVLRSWLRTYPRSGGRIHHVVTIGTPHRGTWLAQFGHGKSAQEMSLGSAWQSQLEKQSDGEMNSRFTCWFSNCDNIVAPASTATLPGADNRLVLGSGHVQLAFLPVVMNGTLALLSP